MILAALSAVVLFFAVTQYVSGVNSKVAPTVTVYRATTAIDAYAVVKAEDIEAVKVPKRWAPPTAVISRTELEGRRISYNVAEGTYLGLDMLLPPSNLDPNEREVAMTVDAKTGIGGRVRSGDYVDVLAVFQNDDDPSKSASRLIARTVRVVSVGGVETRSEQASRTELAERDVIAVTLALTPSQTFNVTLADATATTVRLIGLPAGIQEQDRDDEQDGVTTGQLMTSRGNN